MNEGLYAVKDVYEKNIDKYEEIRANKGKLYIWGCGSVANGLLNELESRQIAVDGLFVDVPNYFVDPRVKEKGYPIVQLDDLLSEGSSFSVIIGHSKYELVGSIKKYSQIKNIWMLQPVTRPDIKISRDFFEENFDGFQKTYDMLSDDESQKNMIAYLKAKISDDASYVYDVFKGNESVFVNDIFNVSSEKCYLDAGAYNGKTMDEFIRDCPQYEKIAGIEVMPDVSDMLKEKYKDNPKVNIYNVGVSDHEGIDYFVFDDQSTCLANDKTKGNAVNVTTIDNICKELPQITTMKICIGGDTVNALLNGAKLMLQRDLPKLVIMVGVDTRALIDYIPQLDEITNGKYRYYLRFFSATTESLALYAVAK
jgi:FkbM family methyltransferase